MRCLGCSRGFKPTRTWNKFCSAACSKAYLKTVRVIKHVAGMPPAQCDHCKKFFQPKRAGHRFCSLPCAHRSHRDSGDGSPKMRVRRRLVCHFCSGRHVSSLCPNRAGTPVKQFGTVDENRQYVPPPGVKVRQLHISSSTHGDTLTELLKQGRHWTKRAALR